MALLADGTTQVTLHPTAHAWHRWRERAPRVIRSRASFLTAVATAREAGTTDRPDAVFVALSMALIVTADGTVTTCVPIAAFREPERLHLVPNASA
jgi:hypothetical protein